jgi:ligand-binding sensor domain-containing protein
MRFSLFIVAFLPVLCLAQHLQFNNVGSEMGIPSQECYNILQDQKGYLWFGTEAGLCRYSNGNLKIFDKRNGLPENCIYAMAEDPNGKLWLASSTNRILTSENGKLREMSFSARHAAKMKPTLELSYIFSFSETGETYINSGSYTFLVSKSEDSYSELLLKDSSTTCHFLKKQTGLIPINCATYRGMHYPVMMPRSDYVRAVIETNDGQQEIRIPFTKDKHPYYRVLTAHAQGSNFFCFENFLVQVYDDGSYKSYEFADRIHNLYVDKDNGLWVGVRKNGVHFYPDIKNMHKKIVSLEGYSVSGVCEDNEKGIWCSTLENGIFYCRDKQVINYNNIAGLNKKASLLKYEAGAIYIAADDNNLVKIKDGNIEQQYFGTKDIFTLIDIVKEEQGWMLGAKNVLYQANEDMKDLQTVTYRNTKFNMGAFSIVRNDNRTLVLQYSHIIEVENGKMTNFSPVHASLGSAASCMIALDNKKLLCGCKSDLYEADINTLGLKKIIGFNAEVTDLLKTKSGRILICTKNDGLYELKKMQAVNITKKYFLENIRMFDMTEDKNGILWIAGNTGLIRIDKNEVKIYGIAEGLTSNDIFKVAASPDRLFFSTNEGIASFPVNTRLENKNAPAIITRAFTASGRHVDDLSHIVLNHDENAITIDFDVFTFKENSSKLAAVFTNSDDTIQSEGNTISLNNLWPGTYELKVFARNHNAVLSKIPATVKFTILQPFWHTWWFLLSCVLLATVLIYFFVLSIVRRIRRNEEEKTKINKLIAESQMSALQAQMNPHFIFNAINSIQGYVLKKDRRQAYDYLAKFSKLIRMVLNNSRLKWLTLEEELETLNLYLELERLRFDNSFDIDLDLDTNINLQETMIPAMLIQPFVENAIWHGLMNLQSRKGKLKIRIIQEGNYISVTISDNGVGREAAKKIRAASHQSAGMHITEERLLMINKLQESEKASIEITDLFDEHKMAAGTKVEIKIPIHK